MEYQITKQGEVINSNGKTLKPWVNERGYLIIRLNSKNYRIHRLVAQTYIPNLLNLPEVNHKDGNKLNNNDWNLEWVSRLENNDHARKNNLTNIGWTYTDITQRNEILKKYLSGSYTYKQLSEEYNISDTTIGKILNHQIKRFEINI